MATRGEQQRMNGDSIRKSPSKVGGNEYLTIDGNEHSIASVQRWPALQEILFIGCDQTARMYTDDVLRRAGFGVRVVAPSEAKDLVNDDGHSWPLVVFSNTLNPQNISEIGAQLRKRSPRSRLLLMLGPDSIPVASTLFDATLESLEGPVALIRAVRRLAEAAIEDGAA